MRFIGVMMRVIEIAHVKFFAAHSARAHVRLALVRVVARRNDRPAANVRCIGNRAALIGAHA